MITLTVISFNDAPHAAGLQARFDELGGTIGRADSNQFVLPDPERTISRVAAQVVFRNGNYAIVDRGSNPIAVNGKQLGSGREAALKEGDKVRIGGYLMQVASAAPQAKAASSDPFADLLGPSTAAPAASGRVVDPLVALAAAPPAARASAPAAFAAPAPPNAESAGIPDNWDPFAPPTNWGEAKGKKASSAVRRAGIGLDTGAAAPPPLVPGLGALGELGSPGKADSLDALFGLTPGGNGADPLAASKLDAPLAQPNMAAHADPMRALSSAPKAVRETASDVVSDLQRPFIPPTTINPPEAAPAVPPAAPSGAVLSWTSTPSETTHTVVNAPSVRRPLRPAGTPTTQPPLRQPAPATVAAPPPIAPAVPSPSPQAGHSAAAAEAVAVMGSGAAARDSVPRTVPSGPSPGDHQLLAAFLQGLDLKDSPMTSLTPEFMRLIGALLRESVAGTVDLLVARAAMKRELRATATTIVARENNPLKFSPSAEAALQHILSPPVRGFMPAAAAMRDAYGDLRAHQFAFVAGMQAALEGVLQRFDPKSLEGQLEGMSVLSSLLPGSRKARMWDVFVEHYTNIREEASEDFHTLFGRAFLKAYEEQLERLQPTGNTQPGVKR